jgi:hypothetical protein
MLQALCLRKERHALRLEAAMRAGEPGEPSLRSTAGVAGQACMLDADAQAHGPTTLLEAGVSRP